MLFQKNNIQCTIRRDAIAFSDSSSGCLSDLGTFIFRACPRDWQACLKLVRAGPPVYQELEKPLGNKGFRQRRISFSSVGTHVFRWLTLYDGEGNQSRTR